MPPDATGPARAGGQRVAGGASLTEGGDGVHSGWDVANESHAAPKRLVKAFALCVLAYVLALCLATAVAYALAGLHPIWVVFAADIAATLVVYTFSRLFSNASLYDPYWSLAPLAIALYLTLAAASENVTLVRQVLVLSLVLVWSVRLTWNWARRWRGLGHEDWRYADLRVRSGRWFWLVELSGIEMMPTLVVFVGCLSLYPALSAGGRAFGALDLVAAVVVVGAIIIEATADEQLERFVRTQRQPGKTLATGLWAFSRHPNYFGEIMFWWGLYLFALAADPSYWWVVAGPVAVTVLFVFVSVPMMDRRNLDRRPRYQEHMRKVSALIPWFPRGD